MNAVARLGLALTLAGCAASTPDLAPPTLTVGVLANPAGLDPALHASDSTFAIARDVFTTLVRLRPGTFDVVPGIASSWSVSADGTVWTFVLRPDLKFSDGTPLDANAVKFNFDRWRSTKDPNHGDAPYPAYATYFGGYDDHSLISEVDAPAQAIVVIHTTAPSGTLLRDLTLPAFGIGSPKAIDFSPPEYDEVPVGAGPYEIVDVRAGEYAMLASNPEWHDAKPAFSSSIVRFIPDPLTSRLALDKSDVDVVLDPLEPELREMAQSPAARLFHGPSDAVCYLAFDTTRPPFSSEALRRAVEDAVDAHALAQFFGPRVSAARGFLPAGMLGAEPALAEPRRDLDRAKALVHGAGLPAATIPFYYPAAATVLMPDPDSVANEIRSELAAANINVDARPTAVPIVLPAADASGGLALVVSEARSGDPDELLAPLDDGWGDATFHARIGNARSTLGDPARARTYRALNAMIRDHVVAVPLVHPFAWSAARAAVKLDAYPLFADRR